MVNAMRPTHYAKKIEQPPGHAAVNGVVTIQEAARMWRKDQSTIRRHIVAGNLTARFTGRFYLISIESLIAYYGHSPLIRKTQTKD